MFHDALVPFAERRIIKMKAVYISDSQINYGEIYECTIHEAPNMHARAVLTGMVLDSESDIIRKISENSWNTIYIADENGNKKILFCGVIEGITAEVRGNVRIVRLELVSGSILMDKEKETRGYQDESVSFGSIIDEKISKTGGMALLSEKCSESIKDILVQYKETDWEFIMRIASKLKLPLIVDAKSNKVVINVGMTGGSEANINIPLEHSVKKRKGVKDQIIEFDSREIYNIGDRVSINGIYLYVYKIDGRYEGGELVMNYELRTKDGCEVETYTNLGIVGASLDASVSEIIRDKVKVKLNVDGKPAVRLFPFSSVYSSPDGTGWYCMPEIGDAVRLYFPSDFEKDAYVINAVHVSDSQAAAEMRDDPDNKCLRNRFGKLVKLNSTSIEISCSDNLKILLEDDKGITIKSDKDINIAADQRIDIVSASDSIQIVSPSNITLKQDNTKLVMEDDITIEGGTLNLQQ